MRSLKTLALPSLLLLAAACSGGGGDTLDGDGATPGELDTSSTDSVDYAGAYYLQSLADAPDCDDAILGQLFYIAETEEFQVCGEDGYFTIDLRGQDGADGADGTNGVDGADGEDGEDGVDGVSINWLGALDDKPADPQLNDAFYWEFLGASCIWDGDSWEALIEKDDAVLKCDNKFTDSRDGNRYEWTRIGDSALMAENLGYLPKVDAVTDASYTSALYYVRDYSPTGSTEAAQVENAKASAGYAAYGAFYNWSAAMVACPSGWHLPTLAEYNTLLDQVIADYGSPVGLHIKAVDGAWATSTGQDDASGFSALGAGYRSTTASGSVWGGLGIEENFWTSDEYVTASVNRARVVHVLDTTDATSSPTHDKELGFSVRCLLD